MATATMTEKQAQSWERKSEYFHHNNCFHLVIADGRVTGYFNSQCGEYQSKIDFAYNPKEKTERDPNWRLATYTNYQEKPPAHGWLSVGSGDNWEEIEVPQFNHPNDLYKWIKNHFGY